MGSLRALLSVAACTLLALGCGAPEPPPTKPAIAVRLEPAAPLDRAPSVVRVRLEGADFDPRLLLVVEGELSSYYLGQILQGVVPSTLAERRIAATAWRDARDLVLAPAVPLASGSTCSVAALGIGLLTTLLVDARASLPLAARVWPPKGASGRRRFVFCGAALDASAAGVTTLDPDAVGAQAGSGADSGGAGADRCFRLDAPDAPAAGVAVPPPALGRVALDPAAVPFGEDALPAMTACSGDERAVATGCIRVLDDRAVVRSSAATLWTFALAGRSVVEPVAAQPPFVLRGLSPSSRVEAKGTATDLTGVETPFDVVWNTLAPMPHVVINEVLANPMGSEPAEEWVELLNDGSAAIDVSGWTLSDESAPTPLPRGVLEPGAFALVVSAQYSTAGPDVPPAPGTLLLRVPRIGRDGLSNAGERLTLKAPDGTVESLFPAVAATKSGVSVARATPESADDDRSAFGPSGGQGASPGAPNVVAP